MQADEGKDRAAGARRVGTWSLPVGVTLGTRVLAALLSLTIIVVGGFYWATFRNFTTSISRVDAIPDRKSQPKTDIDGEDQNILIAGNDDRSTATPAELAELGTTEDGGSINTDTMMVMHLPANGAKAFAISFPRDSYVDIPRHDPAKLNSAYAIGFNETHGSHADKVGAGARLLGETIQNLTGITIDHFVMVDLISFYRISNAVGGVDVCLLHSQRPGRNGETGPGIDADWENGEYIPSYTHINLAAGHTKIHGVQALAFVRQRHGLTSDLDRIKRQQYFLSQTFRTISGNGVLLNPLKQARLLKAISSSLTVDSSGNTHAGLDLVKLARQMQSLSPGDLTFATIPVTDDQLDDGTSILQVDKATVGAFVRTALGLTTPPRTDPAYANAKTVDPSTVSVDVLNGSGAGGAASTNTQTLKQAGFTTGEPGDAPASVSGTTISYPSGLESQAKTLAQYVPGATVTRSTTVQRVTLTLGTDGKQASSTPTTAAPAPPTTPSGSASTKAPIDGGCVN